MDLEFLHFGWSPKPPAELSSSILLQSILNTVARMTFLKYKSDSITLTHNAFAQKPSAFSFTLSIKSKLLTKSNWEPALLPTSFQVTVPLTPLGSKKFQFLNEVKFSPTQSGFFKLFTSLVPSHSWNSTLNVTSLETFDDHPIWNWYFTPLLSAKAFHQYRSKHLVNLQLFCLLVFFRSSYRELIFNGGGSMSVC